MMNDKIKITFAVQESLQQELRQSVISKGYGLRGKSKWVVEAIENLLNLDTYIDLVALSDEMKGFEKVETIMIEKKLKKVLDQATQDIRKKYPLLEGVQSRIIRTSILQRLLRSW